MRTVFKTNFFVKIKDNEKIFLYYKANTYKEEKLKASEEWLKLMTPYEKKKFKKLKEMRNDAETKLEKQELTKKFYEWYYKKHPDRNSKNKSSKTIKKTKDITKKRKKTKNEKKMKTKNEKKIKTTKKEKKVVDIVKTKTKKKNESKIIKKKTIKKTVKKEKKN